MPSLTKDPLARSPFWICCYTSADGRRLKKSTKKRDRAEAWEVCLALERAEALAREGKLTEQLMKKLISEVLERTTGAPLQDLMTGEWLAQWAAGPAENRSKATTVRYQQVIRDFTASLGPRVNVSISQITPADISDYRDAVLKAGRTPRTANLNLKVLSAAFNAALKQGCIETNPCVGLKRLPEEEPARETLTPGQIAALVHAAEGDWKGAVLLGYHTGARLCDVVNMRWSAVDLRRRVITFTPGGKKKSLVIPLPEDLERELLKHPGAGKAFLFPTLAGRATGGRQGLSNSFAALMKKAGITPAVSRNPAGGRSRTSLSFESLRHASHSPGGTGGS